MAGGIERLSERGDRLDAEAVELREELLPDHLDALEERARFAAVARGREGAIEIVEHFDQLDQNLAAANGDVACDIAPHPRPDLVEFLERPAMLRGDGLELLRLFREPLLEILHVGRFGRLTGRGPFAAAPRPPPSIHDFDLDRLARVLGPAGRRARRTAGAYLIVAQSVLRHYYSSVEKREPKRSLLDDQPFLSRLDALDRELTERSGREAPASGTPASETPPRPAPARAPAAKAPVKAATKAAAEPLASSAGAEPPAAPPSTLTYEPFFGLREKPFSLASDPRFVYRSQAHSTVADQLLAAIRRREGIVVLTGDIGTGKTTLCRTIIGQLDRQTFTSRLDDPFLSFEELLKHLLLDFGVVSSEEVTSGRLARLGRHELTLALQEFLRSLALLQAFALVIVDEAQNVSIDLLEHLRILSDLGGSGRLLQVVLVGQEDLRDRLLLSEMRAFNQRISVRASLGPLASEEVAPYVAHRLSVAGGQVVFTKEAIRRLTAASEGVPRVLNLLCDRALTIAAAEGSDRVDGKVVGQACEAIGVAVARSRGGARWWRRPLVAVPALVVLLLAAIAIGLLLWQPAPVRAQLAQWAGMPALPAPPPPVVSEPLQPVPPPSS